MLWPPNKKQLKEFIFAIFLLKLILLCWKLHFWLKLSHKHGHHLELGQSTTSNKESAKIFGAFLSRQMNLKISDQFFLKFLGFIS